jgi:hemerythrin-like metal-binding protein
MPLISWKNDFSVNIAEIDKQHMCLFELINKLHDSMKTGQGNSVIGPILSDLINYTVFHFDTEEKYFKKFQYSEYLRHKIEHDGLRTKAKQLNAEFAAGKVTITVEVLNFLRDWISNHILKSDKKYGEFLRAKGLQ